MWGILYIITCLLGISYDELCANYNTYVSQKTSNEHPAKNFTFSITVAVSMEWNDKAPCVTILGVPVLLWHTFYCQEIDEVSAVPRSFISAQFLFSILSEPNVANDSHIHDWCYLRDAGLDWTAVHTYRAGLHVGVETRVALSPIEGTFPWNFIPRAIYFSHFCSELQGTRTDAYRVTS